MSAAADGDEEVTAGDLRVNPASRTATLGKAPLTPTPA